MNDIPWDESGIAILDIAYSYDESGTVRVEGFLRKTGQKVPIRIEPLPDDVPDRFLLPPDKAFVGEHLTVYVCFDLSGSMIGHPVEMASKAAIGFLENVDLSHASMGIILFANQTKVHLEACQNARSIQRAIKKMPAACNKSVVGGGNRTDPFRELLDILGSEEGKRVAVILTDGMWEKQGVAVERAQNCHNADIDIIAVGFGAADEQFLKQIASSSEEGFLTDLNSLVDAFTGIAQVITESGGLAMRPEGQTGKRSWLGMIQGK